MMLVFKGRDGNYCEFGIIFVLTFFLEADVLLVVMVSVVVVVVIVMVAVML